MWNLYITLRAVGRIAFPIFCFLLIEGFLHTRSRKRYVLRLGLFAILSELPFDIAFNHPANGVIEFGSQNVFFTLFLGLLMLCAADALIKARETSAPVSIAYKIFALYLIATPFSILAEWLSTDYESFGIFLIASLGVVAICGIETRGSRYSQLFLASITVVCYCWLHNAWLEAFAILGLIFCFSYNGQRGRGSKWFFYAFYPTHLLILGLIKRIVFV